MASDVLVNIGSGNGLSPVRRQAITWTNAGLLSLWHSRINLSEIWIYETAYENSRDFCLGLNGLMPGNAIPVVSVLSDILFIAFLAFLWCSPVIKHLLFNAQSILFIYPSFIIIHAGGGGEEQIGAKDCFVNSILVAGIIEIRVSINWFLMRLLNSLVSL